MACNNLKALDLKTNREYQSTIFTTYFGEPTKAARLYEGIVWLGNQKNESAGGHQRQPAAASQKSQW